MRVYTTSADHIQQVSQLLLNGEVVAIPTETVYGLAADALNSVAVQKIYEIKGRPAHNPLIIHVRSSESAERFVHLNPSAHKLIHAFWPGPLTLVLPKKDCIPEIVTAGLSTVGIRCPRHPAMHAILEQIDRPLAAPSANPSNYISPTRIEHVTQHLEGRLKYAIDGGPCEAGLESTIIDLSEENCPKLLRPGPINKADIESVLGSTLFDPKKDAEGTCSDSDIVTSPGQLKVHYSPHTPITLLKQHESFPQLKADQRIATIHFTSKRKNESEENPSVSSFTLTSCEDPKEAANNLYELLQRIDAEGFEMITVDPIPNGPEWAAIRDRLNRAAS